MKKIEEKVVYEGAWLAVHETFYENKDGKLLRWETVHRRKSTSGVVIVARLMPSKKFILIKQYRPAINGYILSLPAGLGHGDPQHALVELKEETGYVGNIVRISPHLKTGASLINDNAHIVYVEVDENLPENKNPQQSLEEAEDISVMLVSQAEGRKFLEEQAKAGVYISANLWYLFGITEFLQ